MRRLIFREDGQIEITEFHKLLFIGTPQDLKKVDNGELYDVFKKVLDTIQNSIEEEQKGL